MQPSESAASTTENTQKSRKKIGFFITKGVWGGAGKYVYNLAASLPKDEYDVFVVTGQGDILKQKLDAASIRTYVIKSMQRDISILKEIRGLFSFFKIVWKEKPDILHLNSPKAAGIGSFVGRVLFVKNIIQTVHGFTWNEERKPLATTLIVFFMWLTLVLCHKSIVLSEREKRQAETLPFIKNKLVLIRNGVETISFKDKTTARQEISRLLGNEKLPENDEGLWVGTISELHKNKGLPYAIEAISKIKEQVKFVIIGSGEEAKNLDTLIKYNKLEDKIFVIGFLPKASEYLKAFDIFTLTSIKEGLPYTILEAGQAGLPVVATAVGGIPEIIQNGVNGAVITPKKPNEITRALEYFINNPDKRKMFGENLQKKVENEFSLSGMLQKTKEIY